MATRNDLYPSRWLSAADCDTPIVATIDRCTIELIGPAAKAERKPIVYFTGGTLKPLVINKTNYDAIVALCGEEDTDLWGGTTLELFAVDVTGPHGPTRGVRVRKPRKAAAPRPAAAATATSDVGF